MSPRGRLLFAALLLALAGRALAIDARIVARVAGDGAHWVGQRVVVEIDLLSTGFSFSGQRFDLPDLPGVVVFPPGSAVLNLNERIDGESWQGLRYELSLFALAPGTVDVPAIEVAFSVAAGYGSEPRNFNLATEPLRVDVKLPEGADDRAGLITTSKFQLEARWEPEPGALKVGDALTLSVRRRASDVPGAAFPPLSLEAPDGIAVYPTEPRISDRTGRGELTGERVDRVSFVLQAAGDYVLPGHVLRWYDPAANILHEQVIEPLQISVAPDPDAKPASAPATDVADPRMIVAIRPWLGVGAALVLAALVMLRGLPWLLACRRRHAAKRAASETGRFDAVLAACRHGDAGSADRNLRAWLHAIGAGRRTASGFAAGNAELAAAVAGLQVALARRDETWSGAALAAALRRTRRARVRRQARRSRHPLAALNPVGGD